MGAMYRLKAYFGMVPAEEMGEYVDEHVPGYGGARRAPDERYASARYDYDDRVEELYGGRGDEWDRRPGRPGGMERTPRDLHGDSRIDREVSRGLSGAGGPGPAAVRGALAVDPDAAMRNPIRDPTLREATMRETTLRDPIRSAERSPAGTSVPEQRDRGAVALARITTLQPRSYKEARTIGEHYRDGQPVIMNLTELDAADAKRLVDFAAGLAFALRGSIDKVTNRVFLLTPADVEVSADDARKLAERGMFRQD
ncbi:cell division protein SepF [Pseudonocardia asaccharolytica]|uniref:Cell division protein SepF n=1 Tax=Pseudonocardia asaccharolytica DSM 44247 = NBRC 16224 TaxID=1123024 RepID=A0A511DBB0_9PSEU|nr:cell division protein SepF [Pseudonocardia asaccharolytica]GEL20944.1 cell division protein SepF [Pseudonocardia asaccharolytica DSM 44247 = NBRC 16224]